MSSIIKQGFCSKLTNEYDNRYTQINSTRSDLNSYINTLKLNIASNTGYAPHEYIRNYENDVESNINNMVPDLTQFDEIVDLINRCTFTKNDSMLSHPSTMTRNILNSVLSNANNFLHNLASLIPTEYALANTINNLMNHLKFFNMNLVIPESFQLLNCMSAICGTDISSRLSQLNSFLSLFNLTPLGTFDMVGFLTSELIPAPTIQSITRVTDQIVGVHSQINTSFTAGIDRLKRLHPDDDDDE